MSNLFSALAAKILLGLLGLSLVFHVIWALDHRRDVRKLNNDIAAYKDAVGQYKIAVATLKGNQATLKAGLASCNASIDNLAAVRNAVTSAGIKALEEVQKAGKSVERKVREIDAMPRETCEDAFSILKRGGN